MRSFKIIFLYTVGGAFLLALLSTFQKTCLGVPLTWNAYIVPVFFGGISGFIAGFLYNTLLKQNEQLRDILQRMEKSEKRYRQLFDSAPEGIDLVDRNGEIMECNSGEEKLLGYGKEEIIGKKITYFMTEKSREAFKEKLKNIKVSPGSEGLFEFKTKDGSHINIWRKCVPDIDSNGEVTGRLGYNRDITDLKMLEQALHESEEKYRTAFQSTPDAVTITIINDGRYLEVNDGFCNITGYSRQEAIGKTPSDLNLFVNLADRDEFVKILKKEGEVNGFELQYQMKDGTVFDTLLSARKLKYGGEDCLLAVVKDITPVKRAEQEKANLEKQLQQAQKMESIGTLAGGISHDFNNLLQSILGYTQIILLHKDREDLDFDKLMQIEKSAKRAGYLTQNLLAFSRKVESKLRPVDLNREVMQVEKLLRRTIPKMIDIELHLENDIKVINADPVQVEQIIMNLCVNSRDALPDGGRLIIKTENAALDEEYCIMHPGATPGEYVLLSISDNGSGMDKLTLGRIFEPFFTTKETGKGTGLGLSMVYGLVKNHGGYITCDSELEQGTTFKLYFPLTIEVMSSEPSITEETMPDGGNETILLVDDEAYLRKLGRDILEKFGYRVLTANDGESAFELYRNEGDNISLIILDLIMPGMGGKKCLEEILRVDPHVNVIIASGYPIDQPEREALLKGARAFIDKPYKLRHVLKVVQEVLRD
ncbi:MAG: PAS domain S-box protein [Thermodesulfobacteriota bacterium]|nr:PAS domain S-box protein [Thermodesulfobacteriota bacterium]